MDSRLEDLSQSFARHLRAEGKAAGTLRLYGQSVRFFSTWLVSNGRPATTAELTRAAIREWLASLVDRGLEPGTVKTRHRGLYRFCKWAVAEDEIPKNPMEEMHPPGPTQKPVPILSDDELACLLKTCNGKTFEDRRDEAMIRLFFDCGPRVSEMSGIDLDDVDLNGEAILVRGKGNKVRHLYPSARTIRALDRYLRARNAHRLTREAGCFLSQRGRMSPDGIRERMLVRARQAGLGDRLHPHRFRHTWAHDFLMEGGQERDLKRLAGWTSDAMLSIYGASAADARAKAAARRLHRGDRL